MDPLIRGEHRPLHVHLMDTGLGAGNSGDDAMFLAAYPHLVPDFALNTEIHSLERAGVFPRGVGYLDVKNPQAIEESIRSASLVLLNAGTPVMDQWGLEWPLVANARKLRLCHQLEKPVHAVGIGVDRLKNPEGLKIFRDSYSPIASWTVRSAHCQTALLQMGVPAEKIEVGADWAWLLSPEVKRQWADEWLRNCGAESGKVNVGVNLVNEIWQDNVEIKKTWAALLDRLIEKHDAQVFFFCNESRPGDYFDWAAATEVHRKMRHPSILVARRYYEPAQMISLLSHMQVTISQRYHFTLFSVLADVYPISLQRGQKMKGLNQELELPFVGDMTHIKERGIEKGIEAVLEDAEAKLQPLRRYRRHLERRAAKNLSLVRSSLAR